MTPRSRPASHRVPEPQGYTEPAPDMSWLVGLAVVVLGAIAVTAALTSFLHRPEGFSVLGLVTQPDPTMNTVAQLALGAVALVLTGRAGKRGVDHWRGDLGGGKGGAIVQAAFAGAALFAAIELFRAAF